MNSVHLKGNLASDVRLRTAGSSQVAEFLLAVSRFRPGADRKTDFIPVVTWGRQATNAAAYLRRGRGVVIEGRINSEFWAPEGEKERLRPKVIAFSIEYLGKPADKEPTVEEPQVRQRTR